MRREDGLVFSHAIREYLCTNHQDFGYTESSKIAVGLTTVGLTTDGCDCWEIGIYEKLEVTTMIGSVQVIDTDYTNQVHYVVNLTRLDVHVSEQSDDNDKWVALKKNRNAKDLGVWVRGSWHRVWGKFDPGDPSLFDQIDKFMARLQHP